MTLRLDFRRSVIAIQAITLGNKDEVLDIINYPDESKKPVLVRKMVNGW
jgi:hypothetical protein